MSDYFVLIPIKLFLGFTYDRYHIIKNKLIKSNKRVEMLINWDITQNFTGVLFGRRGNVAKVFY